MVEQEKIPLKGPRYMDEKITEAMLNMGVKPHKLPTCNHLAATHSSGCSVAGLVARAMRANLNFLQNQVDICWGELMHERDFSVEKLEEHVDILGALNLLLFTITADRISALVNGTPDEARETENVLTQAFAKLPLDDLTIYNDKIIYLRGILEEKVLLEMMELQDKIKEGEETDQGKNWQDDIQMLLHMKIGPKLSMIYDDLGALSNHVGLMIEQVRGDWKADADQIEVDGHA